ncbi:DUF2236 domain-containing protein [Saccharopolyspora sp. HNM0983]|uniref:DUF2236 domain-containing protein n=1 Tax=Saccharopolyspora montiporae TaxID=2781240 RepID=A0A929BBW3_9PSEU|nr:oxygenase MpaB family protein [Saccharopolyspora sp. HNM0983]MBE9375223.1 DUF2236 domain-containing protein [Saccharopolyspora sp. HNM0983]
MRRFERLEHILSLDPDYDCEAIYRLLAEYEFPWDIAKALELALFRTYAVPSIGRLLDRTGEFRLRPQRRYDDTLLLLYEIFHAGPTGPHGQRALDRLNTIHGRYRISMDDYRYTLATFVVMPVRWIREFGWRDLHPHEVRAVTNAMRRMGEGMRITEIPETYAQFEELLDDYERAHFQQDAGGRRVADATLDLFASWYPKPAAPLVPGVARTLMDPHLLRAFGYRLPAAASARVARWALRARAGLLRVGPVRPDSRPVQPDPTLSYPDGYRIEDLGPGPHRKRERQEGARCPVAN